MQDGSVGIFRTLFVQEFYSHFDRIEYYDVSSHDLYVRHVP